MDKSGSFDVDWLKLNTQAVSVPCPVAFSFPLRSAPRTNAIAGDTEKTETMIDKELTLSLTRTQWGNLGTASLNAEIFPGTREGSSKLPSSIRPFCREREREVVVYPCY